MFLKYFKTLHLKFPTESVFMVFTFIVEEDDSSFEKMGEDEGDCCRNVNNFDKNVLFLPN